jgi:precorrin-2 dehydrogenase / sirohydrochlorin ferrochelatase
MRHYPVYLNLSLRKVLLIGGGAVALQKIPALIDAEAQIELVAPEAVPEIAAYAEKGQLHWSRRPYQPSDLEGSGLVIAATDDEALQKEVAAACRAKNIWVNVVDVPSLCDFIAPAIVTRGDIQIAISTGGAAPALAKYLRKKLENVIGPEYVDFVECVRRLRPDILKLPKARRLSLWNCIVSDAFFAEIREKGMARAEERLKEWIYGKPAL